MKTILSAFFLIIALSGCKNYSGEEPKEILYVGTYSLRGSQGIYVYEFCRDSLKFNLLQTLPEIIDPSFLEIHPTGGYIYAVGNNLLSTFEINPSYGTLTLINQVPIPGQGACHVNFDRAGRWACVSNYSSGSMVVYPVNEDGSAGDSVQELVFSGSSVNSSRQEAPHVHSVMVSPDNRHLYLADLGTDRVMIYTIDPHTGRLFPAPTPWAATAPGTGPRHFTFHPSEPYVYVAGELNSTTSVFRRDLQTGRLDEIQCITTLPEDFKQENFVADIHSDPEGKHLYVSNRGHNSLVIYSIDPQNGTLEQTGFEPVRGAHPRNFMIGPLGVYVMIANRDTDNVVVFRRDPSDGSLSFTGITLEVPAAVCLKLHHLESVSQKH